MLRYRLVVGSLMTAFAVAACSTTDGAALDRGATQLRAAHEDCSRRLRIGELHSHVEMETCINNADIRYGPPYPYPDLMALWQAKRLELAAKQDSGKLSDDEAKLQFAEYFAQVETEAAKRRSVASTTNAATAEAWAKMMAANKPYQLPPPVHIEQPKTFSCTTTAAGVMLQTNCQ